MARGIHVDASEVNELAVTLGSAPRRVKAAAAKVFDNEADALHRQMTQAARNHRYLPKFARQMDKDKVSDLHYEIGFERQGQGKLAHIIVFGSANNAPVYDFYAPLRMRTPHLVEYLGRACEDAIFRGSE